MSYNSILSLQRAGKWAHEQKEPWKYTKPLKGSDNSTLIPIQSDNILVKSWKKKKSMEGLLVFCQHVHTVVSVCLLCNLWWEQESVLESEGALSHYSTPSDYSWLECQNIHLLPAPPQDDLHHPRVNWIHLHAHTVCVRQLLWWNLFHVKSEILWWKWLETNKLNTVSK